MALPAARVLREGKTPHPWERDAIEFAKACLPNHDPYHLLALFEVQDPGTSRYYEIDLLVVGYSQLYLVECKGHPGLIEGDARDWYWTPEAGGSRRYFGEHPLRLNNHKAKITKGILEKRLAAAGVKGPAPYVEPLVFLSAPGLKTSFRDGGELGVVTRATFERAITRAEFPGSRLANAPFSQRPAIQSQVLRPLFQILRSDPAFRASKSKLTVLGYELGDVIREGTTFQERIAKHPEIERLNRLARVYVVPEGSTASRATQLRHAAEREAKILWDLRDHEGILRATDYSSGADIGPTVLFDAFENGEPLDAFVRQRPDLPFDERVEIIEQIGRALAFCHRKSIVHGAFGPHSVLVRTNPDPKATRRLETRLVHFHLGSSSDTSGTRHWTQLAGNEWSIYQAPELREGAERHTSVDVFGLGATAYFVLTGRPPAETGLDAIRRLATDKGFDPRVLLDDLDPQLASLVLDATRPSIVERHDDVGAWTELFVEHARKKPAPSTTTGYTDPLVARRDDILEGDLIVHGVLGQGATARVLDVERDGERFALKVALEPRFDERLREEAAELRHLHHAHIVRFVDELTVGARRAILMTIAGDQTLQRSLESEGVPALDLAARYGEQLLSALEHLEEERILHRDIKPANLGVGAVRKERKSLTLFDFSLSRAPLEDLDVGTSAYRDPYLPLRPVEASHSPTWDHAADRWSAAITLHELVTGIRPHFAGKSAVDPDAQIVLAAERFDATVRDGLLAFFTKALARDVRERFETAERMRKAWLGAIDASLLVRPAVASTQPGQVPAIASLTVDATLAPDALVITDDVLASIEPTTPVAALPLSTRAKNALDRAKIERTEKLGTFPAAQLSMLPGVGRAVQGELLGIRNRWLAARQERSLPVVAGTTLERPTPHGPTPHGPAPHGPTTERPTHEIEPGAPRGPSTTPSAEPPYAPDSLEGLCQELLGSVGRPADTTPPKKGRPSAGKTVDHHHHARCLFGLEGPCRGQIDPTVKTLATALEITPQAIYIALSKSRAKWAAHPRILELVARVRALLEQLGGVVTLSHLARALCDELPLDTARGGPRSEADLVLLAAALVRITAEVDASISFVRLERTSWIASDPSFERVLRVLGHTADELAQRTPLPTPAEATRRLREALQRLADEAPPTPGLSLPGVAPPPPLSQSRDDRVLALAAEASERAALSARLELYPRELAPERALEHSAAMLRGEHTAEAVQELVKQRYPEAKSLPPRPELDRLLEGHGLVWNEARGRYVRKGYAPDTTLSTQISPSLHPRIAARSDVALGAIGARATLSLGPSGTLDSAEVQSQDFDESVRLALELRSFRVLAFREDVLIEGMRVFCARYAARLVWLDRLLVSAMFDVARAKGIPDLGLLHRADNIGPERPADWANLTRVAALAAERLIDQVFSSSSDQPLLLARPGLLARYALLDAATALFERARSQDSVPTFLAMPTSDVTNALPTLGPIPGPGSSPPKHMPIPGLLPAQILRVPRSFTKPAVSAEATRGAR